MSDPDNPFVPVKYTDATGSTVTKTMYFRHPQLHGLLLGQRETVHQGRLCGRD